MAVVRHFPSEAATEETAVEPADSCTGDRDSSKWARWMEPSTLHTDFGRVGVAASGTAVVIAAAVAEVVVAASGMTAAAVAEVVGSIAAAVAG